MTSPNVPRGVAAAELRVSGGDLRRAGVTGPISRADLEAWKENPPPWLAKCQRRNASNARRQASRIRPLRLVCGGGPDVRMYPTTAAKWQLVCRPCHEAGRGAHLLDPRQPWNVTFGLDGFVGYPLPDPNAVMLTASPGDVLEVLAPFMSENGAVCTLSSGFTVDVGRTENGELRYGHEPYCQAIKALLMAKLFTLLLEGGGLTLRTFTNALDAETGLPIKELRGWLFTAGTFVPVSADDLKVAFETDPDSGELLVPEPAVVFPDPQMSG
jgi:hypothetical protein